MMYSSPASSSCYPNEHEDDPQPPSQDPRQDATSPIAAAGGISTRRSSQPHEATSLSHPGLLSVLLPTVDDDAPAMSSNGSGTVDILSSQPSSSGTTASDRRRADMSNIMRIIDQALEILDKGDVYSLDDSQLDQSILFYPS